MADSEPQSGVAEHNLRNGREASWRFTPGEPRLLLKLPEEFGGAEHRVSLQGGYELRALASACA